MKKVLTLLLVAGMATIVSCGPSAEEKAAAEKAIQDSIANAQQMIADSLAAVEQAAAVAAAQQAVLDSIAAVEKEAAEKKASKPKPKPKTIEEKKIEEAKKVTGGRG